jgi:hypothetical protein
MLAAAPLALGLVVLAGVGSLGDRETPLARVVPGEVDVDGVVPAGRGLVGEEAARALAPFEDDEPRCRPLGCERWWRPAEGSPLATALVADTLVTVLRDEVVALDLEAGSPRWVVPVGAFAPDPATGWRLRTSELQLAGADDALVVYSPRGYLQLRDAAGVERWSVTQPATRRIWDVALTDDVVLVASAEDRRRGPVELVTAYDRDHGTTRWRQEVRWTYGLDEQGALVRTKEDRVVALAPRTGRPAATLAVDDPRWVATAGAFHVARVAARDTLLLDRGTGEVVRTVSDVAGLTAVGDEAGAVALLVSGQLDDDGELRPTRIEVVAPDGTTRWERPLGCCVTLLRGPPGTVAVRAARDDGPLLLDAADGQVVSAPRGLSARDEVRWLRADLVLSAGAGGRAVLTSTDGRRITVADDVRVLTADPLVVATSDGIVGLDLPGRGVRRPMRGFAAPSPSHVVPFSGFTLAHVAPG